MLREAPPQDLTVRTFALRVDSINEEERSIEAVLATETPTVVFDFRDFKIVEEILRMDGVVLPPGGRMPLLDSHMRFTVENQLGSVVNIRVERKELLGRNNFSSVAADEWTKVREGHVTDNSIGYRVLEFVDIAPGTTETIKGVRYTAGTLTKRITLKWQPRENSILPIGADQFAKMRELHRAAVRGKDSTMKTFEEYVAERGLEIASLTDEQRDFFQAEYDSAARRDDQRGEPEDTNGDGKTPLLPEPVRLAPATIDQSVLDEQARAAVDKAQAESATANKERIATIRADAEGIAPDLVRECVDDPSCTADQARKKFLEAIRKDRIDSPGSPAIHVLDSSASREVIECAMLQRQNVANVYDEKNEAHCKLLEQAERYRHASIIDFLRMGMALDGVRVSTFNPMDIIGRAASTTSLPTILGNVANKSLLAGYEEQPATALGWARDSDHSNFLEHTKTRISEFGDLELVTPGGELKHGTRSEIAEKLALETFGKIFKLTREQIINDDLGALTDSPRELGRAAMRKIDDVVYTVLLANATLLSDSVVLFHANHGNLQTGAGSALGDTSLAKARELLRKQTGIAGASISIEPVALIVPPELEHTALKLLHSVEILEKGNTDSVFGTANVHKGTLELTVEQRLSNTAFHANNSATAWYVVGRKATQSIDVAFLRGFRQPTVQRVELQAEFLGVGWRTFFDVAGGANDFRSVNKSDGA